tara:strand:+ start:564 stop:764 length:201 start_codon:yes stop_codon:yes gene_type:complete
MFCKEVVNVQDSMYLVIRKIKIESKPIIQTWKEYLRVDIVFKKDPYYYFCEIITEIIPEEVVLVQD